MDHEADKTSRDDAKESEQAADWATFSRRLVDGLLPDMMRKSASGALNTFLQTEEGVRTLLGAVSRELLHYARDQVDKSKAEIVTLVTRELREHLARIDLGDELERILPRMNVEVTASIRFTARDSEAGMRPEIVSSTSHVHMGEESSEVPKKRKSRAPRKKQPGASGAAKGRASTRKNPKKI